jgi:hypothetical protein
VLEKRSEYVFVFLVPPSLLFLLPPEPFPLPPPFTRISILSLLFLQSTFPFRTEYK